MEFRPVTATAARPCPAQSLHQSKCHFKNSNAASSADRIIFDRNSWYNATFRLRLSLRENVGSTRRSFVRRQAQRFRSAPRGLRRTVLPTPQARMSTQRRKQLIATIILNGITDWISTSGVGKPTASACHASLSAEQYPISLLSRQNTFL